MDHSLKPQSLCAADRRKSNFLCLFGKLVLVCVFAIMPPKSSAEPTAPDSVSVELTTNLTQCPDCLKEVSKRAVMCPSCGCPGEAIKEALKAREEAARPKMIVSVIADGKEGFGVAIREGEFTYIVLEAFLLANSTKLELHDLVSGANLPYTAVQLADDLPLMRLRVASDKVKFLPIAPSLSPPASFMSKIGLGCGKDHMAAELNAENQVSGMFLQDRAIPLHKEMKWKSVSPKPLRQQLNLLARLQEERNRGSKPTLSESEANIHWLTSSFSKMAADLLR